MSGDSENIDDQNDDTVIIDFTPVCWYGTACYRKNPEHFRHFRHPHLPSDPETEAVKESVEIKIEIGHDATFNSSKNKQGHTHDWTAFVRCANQNAIGLFIEKVEFNFPQCIPHPPHIVNQPPFNVTDSGSRSFILDIDISFKNPPDPKKTRFNYNLYLKDKTAFSNIQLVNLVIQNPSRDFRQNLLLAGGVAVQAPSNSPLSNIVNLQSSTSSSTNKRKINDSTQAANDEFEAFGQLCTTKLRKLETLSPPQKTLAEKLISDVLFHAEQKSLTNDSYVRIASTSPTVDDVPASPQVKTEPASSSTSPECGANKVIKSEDDTSSEALHQVVKPEVDSPSSSIDLSKNIKSEVDTPSSSSDIDECVVLQVIEPKVNEPVIIDIKEEIDKN